MPGSFSKICGYPGCYTLVHDGSSRCAKHPKQAWVRKAPSPPRIRGRKLQAARKRLFQANPLCVECERQGKVTLATIRDHTHNLADGGEDIDANTQGLCRTCHDIKSWNESRRGKLSPEAQERRMPSGLQPSRIPLTIVCGAPGSGKSTYIRERATTRDIIIDLDAIMSKLSGLHYHTDKMAWIGQGLDERNRVLRSLATDTEHECAWFIIAAPDRGERAWWARTLGAELVVLDTPLDECIRRINADTTRQGEQERMSAAARSWWAAQHGAGYV